MGSKIVSSFKWTTVERFSVQSVQFVLGIIIARLVTPEEYGVLGILMVFVTVSQVFIDSGLGSALICQNDLRREDVQTTFTFNLLVSLFFCAVLFVAAPYIEAFYALEGLAAYMRVVSLMLITNSLIVVPTTIFKVRLDFRSLAISNICSTVISGLIGVCLAYCGYGVWALVGQVMSKSALQSVFLYVQCRWLPTFSFSLKAFKGLYKYGVNVFFSTFITRITDEGSAFIIAKVLTPFNLGVYSRSCHFVTLPSSCLGSIINVVMFPAFSSLKNDRAMFNHIHRKAIECQAAVTMPLYIAFALAAEPLILILLTDKWIAVVPVLQIMCCGRLLSLIVNITEQVLLARGRSDLFLKQQLVKMGTKFVLVMLALPMGILAVAAADAVATLSNFAVTNYFARGVSEFRVREQLRAVLPYLLSSFVAGAAGLGAYMLADNVYVRLALVLAVYAAVYYAAVTFVCRKTTLNEIINRVISYKR